MSDREAREMVVAAAATWLGTPFHDNAAIKGVGVDCAHLIAQAYEEAGIIGHLEIEPYSPQWFLHRSTELFIGYILAAGAQEIEEPQAQAGDIVMYKVGRCYAHGAIIAEWPLRVIHAHRPSGGVVTAHGLSGDLLEAPRRFFTLLKEI